MKPASITVLAWATQVIASPLGPNQEARRPDLEGGVHTWSSNWLHQNTAPADPFTAARTAGGAEYGATTSGGSSIIGQATPLSKRQFKPNAILSSIQLPTTKITAVSQTTTRAVTTTTTLRTTTTAPKTTTAAAAAPSRTFDVTGLTYQNAMLTVHNFHRANASIPNLVWDASLALTAQMIAASCYYGHNVTANGGGYGQNIGAGAKGNAAAGLITNLMYNGEINYYPGYGNDNPDLSGFGKWGHYSQIVWTDTTNVGCFTQYCPLGLANTGAGVAPYFTVCNYSPPGNYVGEFSEVAVPKGGQTVVVIGS